MLKASVRALSSIVASVLILVISVSLAATVFFLYSSLTSELEGKGEESLEYVKKTVTESPTVIFAKVFLDKDLVLCMNFEEYYFCDCEDNNCDVCFRDCSRYGNDGILMGNIKASIYTGTYGTFRWIPDSGGLYVNFTQDGCIKVSGPVAANGSKTIVAIVKPITIEGGRSTIICTTDTGWGKDGYAFAIQSDGRLFFRIGNTTTYEYKVSGISVEMNKTNFIAVVYSQQNHSVTFYINSTADGPYIFSSVTWYPSKSAARIGGEDCSGNEHGIESIFYEILVYNRALSQEEIEECYESISKCPRDYSLILHLSFDEGKGTYVNDLSAIKKGELGNYLNFNGQIQIKVTNLYVNNSTGGKNTVLFFMNWSGINNMMPIGWQDPYDLWINYGCFGFNTGQNNILGVSSSGLERTWHHIAAVFYNGVPAPDKNELWIDGEKKNIYSCYGFTTLSRTATPTVYISGWGVNRGYKFIGDIDELLIYNKNVSNDTISIMSKKAAPYVSVVLETENPIPKGARIFFLDNSKRVLCSFRLVDSVYKEKCADSSCTYVIFPPLTCGWKIWKYGRYVEVEGSRAPLEIR